MERGSQQGICEGHAAYWVEYHVQYKANQGVVADDSWISIERWQQPPNRPGANPRHRWSFQLYFQLQRLYTPSLIVERHLFRFQLFNRPLQWWQWCFNPRHRLELPSLYELPFRLRADWRHSLSGPFQRPVDVFDFGCLTCPYFFWWNDRRSLGSRGKRCRSLWQLNSNNDRQFRRQQRPSQHCLVKR